MPRQPTDDDADDAEPAAAPEPEPAAGADFSAPAGVLDGPEHDEGAEPGAEMGTGAEPS